MSLFRHPHLVRGIVHTREGAFVIHRGIVELPEDVGDSLGWLRLDDDPQSPMAGHVSGPHHEVTQEKESDGLRGDDGCAGSQSQRNEKSCRAPAFGPAR